jgi:hypothetical protein
VPNDKLLSKPYVSGIVVCIVCVKILVVPLGIVKGHCTALVAPVLLTGGDGFVYRLLKIIG